MNRKIFELENVLATCEEDLVSGTGTAAVNDIEVPLGGMRELLAIIRGMGFRGGGGGGGMLSSLSAIEDFVLTVDDFIPVDRLRGVPPFSGMNPFLRGLQGPAGSLAGSSGGLLEHSAIERSDP